MINCLRLVLPLLLLLATVIGVSSSAVAADRVSELPAIQFTSSGRFDLAFAIDDDQVAVAKGEFTSATRAHFVIKGLDSDGSVIQTVEFVQYDDLVYVREDTDPQWYVRDMSMTRPIAPPMEAPMIDVEATPISRIGPKEIAGVLTTQYQIWFSGNQPGAEGPPIDHVALDLFVGQEINYLYQYQISAFMSDGAGNTFKLQDVMRLYDFNDPSIIVGIPANAIPAPTPTAAGLMPRLTKGGLLSTLAMPLATPELRALVLKRLDHE